MRFRLKRAVVCGALRWSGRAFHSLGAAAEKARSPMVNIHIDNPSSVFANNFTSLLDCLGITQHVNLPTHNKGHILDLICCTDITPTNLDVTDFPISDHKAILFDIHTQLHKAKVQWTVSFRNIKHIVTAILYLKLNVCINC